MGDEKRGRPSVYNQEIADKICERLANGETLTSICDDDGYPARATVINWALNKEKYPGFFEQYDNARLIGYHGMADEIKDIVDDGRNDYTEKLQKNGDYTPVVDNENIQRSRLRVDTRKWLLSKCLPKIYGDRLEIDNKSTDGSMSPANHVTYEIIDPSDNDE